MASLNIAYGSLGVPRLVAAISDATASAEAACTNLTTLNSLLSNQESKSKAISHQPPLVPVLTKLLASESEELLHLGIIHDRTWRCLACSAVRDHGLADGLRWLAEAHAGELRASGPRR